MFYEPNKRVCSRLEAKRTEAKAGLGEAPPHAKQDLAKTTEGQVRGRAFKGLVDIERCLKISKANK